LALKWLGLGLLAGVTTLVSLDYATRSADAPALVPAAPAARPAERRPATASKAMSNEPALAPDPSAPAPPPASAPHEANHAPSATLERAPTEVNGDAFTESGERALVALQAVRAALAAHAPGRALGLLAAFDKRMNAAVFAEEAAVLRIQALADAGRASEARALATDFLSRYPHSAYAERVRSKVQLP